MNTLRLTTFLTLALCLPAAGCDSKDECIADCSPADSESGTTETSGGSSDASGSGSSTGLPASCEDDAMLAAEFLAQNRDCESSLDCMQLDAICYPGADRGPCGGIAVSKDADADAWNEVHGRLQSCETCGADPCGSTVMCTDAGQCESVLFSDAYCPSIERDIETFLANNRACETADDCQGVDKGCYSAEASACTLVGLNTSADLEDWEELSGAFMGCADTCDSPECGARVECSPQGQCTAVFP